MGCMQLAALVKPGEGPYQWRGSISWDAEERSCRGCSWGGHGPVPIISQYTRQCRLLRLTSSPSSIPAPCGFERLKVFDNKPNICGQIPPEGSIFNCKRACLGSWVDGKQRQMGSREISERSYAFADCLSVPLSFENNRAQQRALQSKA